MNRPNILYIHSHDTGRYTQPYGHAVQTPNIQKLAEEGVLFRQAFSVASMCTPSRVGLLTGQFPHSSGLVGLAHRGFSMRDYSQHIVHTLRNVGYYSALFGVQHIAPQVETIGYDLARVQDSRPPEVPSEETHFLNHAPRAVDIVDATLNFLNNAPAQPFFLSVGFFETHREFPSPEASEDPNYCLVPPVLPDTPETRQDMAGFKASARILDTSIGQVLEALEANKLAENTLVICTTDHGLPMPGMKCTLTDHGIGVSLIMRGPGGFRGGRVCEAMVSQLDLFPTICELLEIAPPSWLQGQSILPLMREEVDEINAEIFAEINFHAAYEPQRAVRTKRYKYIRRFDGRGRPVASNIEDSLSKDIWLENGWRERPVPIEQLYDLIFDPNESNNLINDPSMTTILKDMRSRLDNWMKATNDPLLHGPIVAPAGAQFNDPDGLSPYEPTITQKQT